MELLLVRHGATEWNLEKRMQGSLDSPLLKEGIEWAMKAADFLSMSDISTTYMLSSPLKRAFVTAEYIARKTECRVETMDYLSEMNHGLFDGLTLEEAEALIPGFSEKRAKDRWNIPWPKGESYADVYKRALIVYEHIANLSGFERIICVAHETINKVLAGAVCGWTKETIMSCKQPNNHIFYIEKIDHKPSFKRIEG